MNSRPLDWLSSPATALRGGIEVPGDKSISHRALMLGAIADGTTGVCGFLESADTRATENIMRALGVRIEAPNVRTRRVHGAGPHGLQRPRHDLDCGNAGTTMRLLAGLLAGQHFDSTLAGDASLSRRPMRRVIDPLAKMGARIDAPLGDCAPLRIRGGQSLRGIDYRSPVASAQVKSAVLLAGLYAQGETRVTEPQATRDCTERLLAAFGYPVAYEAGRATLQGGHRLSATEVVVPADFSAAAFFIAAATLVPGSELRLVRVGLNPRRTGLLRVLRAMGADITEESVRDSGSEPIGDLHVRHAPLRGIDVPAEDVADMIDEFPILFVAAAAAEGPTVVRGAAELRFKESDRIAVMAAGLRALGARIEESPDGAVIEGSALQGGEADAQGDHRCAMAFAVAGAIARTPVHIRECANVATSFPEFQRIANTCGFRIEPA